MCLDGHLQRCPRGSWMHCRPWEYATHLRFPRFLRVRSELEEHGGEVKFYTRGPYYTLPTVLRAYNAATDAEALTLRRPRRPSSMSAPGSAFGFGAKGRASIGSR
uniref:Uncharacterized protein n=1 Tax=Physcomitrium patens TaxID=3218 RepID=A0A7I4EJM1_PHYPA